jgi:hypothetical protein
MLTEQDVSAAIKEADLHVREIMPVAPVGFTEFRRHSYINVDEKTRTHFYLADFVRRNFSARKLGKNDVEGKKMYHDLEYWKREKVESTTEPRNISTVQQMTLESVSAFAAECEKKYLDADLGAKGLEIFYRDQNSYWFKVHTIAREAVRYKNKTKV